VPRADGQPDPAFEPTLVDQGAVAADATDAGAPTAGQPTTARTGSTTVISPQDALALEEINRTRIFLRFAMALCVAVVLSLSFLSGHLGVKTALYAAVGACAVLVVWMHQITRDPAQYTPFRVILVGWWCAATTMLGVVYWGIFSPAPALIVLGIYFFSRTNSLAATLLIYATCAVSQAVMSILILSGALADPGLFPASGHLRDMAISQGMVQLTYLFSFWLARATRRTTLDAIGRLEVEVRHAARRAALLFEAQQDLERALRIGGPGRYTDQVLAGYRLGAVIGRGAMGEVYDAVHETSGAPAAAKLLLPGSLQSGDQVERFLREARAASAFTGDHVARVLASSTAGDPLPFLIMERLVGEDLASYLRRVLRMPADQLLELVDQVGGVLDQARAHDIVHRDLKPHNIFRARLADSRQVWKVLDFGVSKLGDQSGTLTRGQVIGTPAYMAPEQARGHDVDHRADLYALSALIYRAMTGQPPFAGPDLPAILYAVVHGMPPAPSQLTRLPPAVDAVLLIGLAKVPQDRFESAADLRAALAQALHGDLDPETLARARRLQASLGWGSTRPSRRSVKL
jgi:eukaryotic-like serine/threonine-protein kinase